MVGCRRSKGVVLKFRTPSFVPPEPLGARIPSSNIEVIAAVSSRAKLAVLSLNSFSKAIFFFLFCNWVSLHKRIPERVLHEILFFFVACFSSAVLVQTVKVNTLVGDGHT